MGQPANQVHGGGVADRLMHLQAEFLPQEFGVVICDAFICDAE